MSINNDPANIPLAIVGMGCRLPEAENLDAFWKLLVEGRSGITEMPPERMNQALYYDPNVGVLGKSYCRLAATLKDRTFRRELCPLPKKLEESVDLAHLLMCETAACALRQAGMDPFNLPHRNAGVYVGHVVGSTLGCDYTFTTSIEEAAEFLEHVDGFKALPAETRAAIREGLVHEIRSTRACPTKDSADVSSSMVSGTIAEAFGLTGPVLALDSACASSLQAMLLGARALQLGQIDMAIVGGASDTKATTMVLFSAARSMSSTGSRPFDEEADGLICGEGYVALVMKTLERALADGDPIQAVVRGLGVSSDGKGKSLWAPRKEGQLAAMKRAYPPGVDMSSLQYIEAHATATKVGDATELETLSEILTPVLPAGHKIPIGALKANIGHTLESAGVSGLIKSVLAMQNRTIPPVINVNRLNPKVDWDKVPVQVPLEQMPWPDPAPGVPRRAGVNAFGIGGLNMHILLEEFDESTRTQFAAAAPPEKARIAPPAKTKDEDAVAVIGMGCIFPGALNVDEYWQLVKSGRDPKQTAPTDRWRIETAESFVRTEPYKRSEIVGGFITNFEYDWRAHKVPPKQVANADPLQFMLLEATDQAFKDSGYADKPFDRSRTGVLVGSEFGGDFAFQLQIGLQLPEIDETLYALLAARGITGEQATAIVQGYAKALLKDWPALVDETGSFTASTLASRLTKTWDLMGGAAAIDSSSASGMTALSGCVNALLAGDADMMVCAAGQRRMGIPEYEILSRIGTLAEPGTDRSPLDANSGGLLPGEGVGVLLLKRLSQAKKDGDRIHSVIHSVGAAYGLKSSEALQLAMQRSFERIDVKPADVAIMEYDGCGKPNWIADELAVVTDLYKQSGRKQPLLISSVTAQIGHTEAGSSMASLIKANLELENRELPATFGLEQPMPVLANQPDVARAVGQSVTIQQTAEDGGCYAGVSSCSSRMAYHLVVERGEKVPVAQRVTATAGAGQTVQAGAAATPSIAAPIAAADSSDWRICRMGAGSQAELLQQLAAPAADPQLVYHQANTKPFTPHDKCRLAIVADSVETCRRKLEMARKQISNPASRQLLEQQGIFCYHLPQVAPRVALVFSGQGSQYNGMLRALVDSVPAAAAAMQEVDTAAARLGYPTFAQLAWDETTKLGTDIWATQLSLLMADHIVHQALTDRGVRGDLVLGHSYGEYPALLAAGAWDLETNIQVTRARCQGAVTCQPSKLMATTAPAELVESLKLQVAGPIHVAIQNAPDQLVVGGTEDSLQQLAALIQAQSYRASIVPVPCAFHTPLVADANRILEPAVRAANIQTPRIPMYSFVTQQASASADEIRNNIMAHYTTPLMYVDFIRRVANEASTVFVEVGPNQVLTRLHRQILDGTEFMAVASDNSKRPGVEQLLCVEALLDCVGAMKPVAAPTAPVAATSAKPAGQPVSQQPAVVHFDATERRREKMRLAAQGKPTGAEATPATPPTVANRQAPPASAPLPPVQTSFPSPASQNGNRRTSPASSAASSGSADPSDRLPTPPQTDTSSRLSAEAFQTPAAAAPQATTSPAELENFLVDFVVQQTGYPPEVVELDADLEADLGIDSIKKAQLFGELQEYFDVTPTEDLTLDDFPTLRDVVNFLADVPPKKSLSGSDISGPTGGSAVAEPAPAQPAASQVDLSASTAPIAAAPSATAAAAAPTTPTATGSGTAELEAFLIDFVVEQTGYPAEVVELDADLEADLGIDSIKKAQLFGELQEYFDVTPTEDMTLDDFPTLRHVVDFLADVPPKKPLSDTGAVPAAVAPTAAEPAVAPAPVAAPETATPVAQPPAAGSAPTASGTAELETFLINFVVEQTGYPPEVVELDADLEADLGIDSIKKAQLFGELQEYFDVTPTEDMTLDDFPTLRHVVDFLADVPPKKPLSDTGAAPAAVAATAAEPAVAPAPVATPQTATPVAQPPAAGSAPTASGTAELETFLINFVVEQTGYPPEVVELDADLEADLGIDSIKKAQLFGELQEYFDVTPAEDMTLDDFPTLRHVVDFLADVPPKKPLSDTGAAPAAVAPTAAEPAVAPAPVAAPETATPVAQPPAAGSAPTASGTAELETFLINFVVEQTGYPPEVVELDADLEADLGIDSIKKAQLFGELQEYFDVTPTDDLTLDDFPTLRHVVDFLADVPAKRPLSDNEPTPTVEERTPAAPVADDPVVAPAMETSEPAAAPVTASAPSAGDAAELETFLINFVVEQTGYPPEVVELDADLEADLGIDSIKKAQLFGELQEYFDVTPTDDLTLDDFPTLRHVVDFLANVPAKRPLSDNEPTPTVEERTPAAPVADDPVVAPAMETSEPAAAPVTASAPSAGDAAELETFLINFVVEQTGYPPEVVELDADLEADLGIDSIKKAQLFGELQEYFDVTPTDDLTLDDFPTLRHVVDFLADVPNKKPLSEDADQPAVAGESESMPTPVEQPMTPAAEPPPAPVSATPQTVATAKAIVASTGPRQIELRGTPYEIGYQHGQQMRDEIRRSLRRMADLAGTNGELTVSPEAIKDPAKLFSAEELSELEGIAAAAQVPFGNILAFNVAMRSALKDAPQLLAQTKNNGHADTHAAGNGQPGRRAQLARHIVPVVQSRNPSGRAAHTLLLPAGVCGGWNGTATDAADEPLVADSPAIDRSAAKYDHAADSRIEPLTDRFAMRMLQISLPPDAPTAIEWNGAALVVGDSEVAKAMRQRLASDGVTVSQLQTTGDVDTDLAAFDRLWEQQPILHLFIATGRDAEASQLCGDADWDRRYQCGVLWPLLLCQRWMQRVGEARLLDQSTLASMVNLGGDFGFSGSVAAPEGGALTGLMKAIHVETVEVGGHGGMCVKAIDAPATEPAESLVENTLRELAGKTADYEVAFVDGKRFLQNAYSRAAVVADYAEIQPGETWVVTGGARGITAECAMELGRRFGLKLHLIGTSRAEDIDPAWRDLSSEDLQQLRSQTMIEARQVGQTPNEAWQRIEKQIEIDKSLRRFAEAGIQATYHACDIADRSALDAVLHSIRQADGAIGGILHGAGIQHSCRIEKKTREVVQATLGAKVAGAYNLMTLTRQDPVHHFIGFGSISGRLGSHGQADYCAASDMLGKLVSWYRTNRPECRSVAFHFSPWDEIGMAAKPEVKSAIKLAGGPLPMPKQDGIRQFLREVYAGLPDSEILITTPEYHQRFYRNDEIEVDDDPLSAATATTSTVEDAADQSSTAVTERLVVRMLDAPLSDTRQPAHLQQAAVILGDNAVARALQAQLAELGAAAYILPTSEDPDQVIAALDQVWQQQPVQHLFLATPHDQDAGGDVDEAQHISRRDRGAITPFMVCQHWLRRLEKESLVEGATLFACTALGGDFGISGRIRAPESGALTGLIKDIQIEGGEDAWKGLKLRAIDFGPEEEPQAIAQAICDELTCDDQDLEVGYQWGARRVVRVLPEAAVAKDTTTISPGDVWVVTGGARGVTAIVARALGKTFGVKLHLLGSSPPPQIDPKWHELSQTGLKQLQVTISRQAKAEGRKPLDAWKQVEKGLEIDRTLRELQKDGVQATYHGCDVADRGQLAAVLDQIRQTDGPIRGVIHGAGVTIDAKFLSKKRENVLRTVRAKVDGAAALMALTAQDPLRHFIGFGSVSGRFGSSGQADYCTANDMMCKQIDLFAQQRPECHAFGIHWHAWDDVGMAVQPDVKAMLEARGYRLMPPSEGVEHVIREIAGGDSDTEVIYTDTEHYRTEYPLPVVTSQEELQAAAPARTESTTSVESSDRAASLPLIDQVLQYEAGRKVVVEACFRPTEDPFLIDHRMGDRPFLPAVISMELVAQAASLLSHRTVARLRDIEIHNGLPFATDDPRNVRVEVEATDQGAACRVTSDVYDRKGRLVDAARLLMTALVEYSDTPVKPTIPHCGLPPLGWFPMYYPDEFAVTHGPRMRYLLNAFCQYDGGFGRIVAPELKEIAGDRGADHWFTSPAVMDACLVACSTFAFVMFEKRNSLPMKLKCLNIADLPRAGEECIVRIYFRGKDEMSTNFDFVLFGEDQRVIASGDSYVASTIQPRTTRTS